MERNLVVEHFYKIPTDVVLNCWKTTMGPAHSENPKGIAKE